MHTGVDSAFGRGRALVFHRRSSCLCNPGAASLVYNHSGDTATLAVAAQAGQDTLVSAVLYGRAFARDELSYNCS